MKCFLLLLALATLGLTECGNNRDTVKESPVRTVQSKEETKYATSDFDSISLAQTVVRPQGISIAYPVAWTKTTTLGLWACKMPCADTPEFCANYVINSVPQQGEAELGTYAEYFVSQFKIKSDVQAFELINSRPQTIKGLSVEVIDYKFTINNKNMGGTTVLFKLGKNIIVVNFAASNNPPMSYLQYRGLYERIIQSIEPLAK